jgi:hypothetical protein
MNLRLYILAAALLPTLAVIWSRLDARYASAERVQTVRLIAALHHQSSIGLQASHDLTKWLEANPRHTLAPDARELLRRAAQSRPAADLEWAADMIKNESIALAQAATAL